MNILVVGNGFDLAHKLPTSYLDFLAYILDKDYLKLDDKSFIDDFNLLIEKNFWIKYFSKQHNDNRTWIDFELEISKVIKSLDFVIKYNSINGGKINELELPKYINIDIPCDVALNTFDCFNKIISISSELLDDPAVTQSLLYDLNQLIRGLEVYLDYVVNTIPIQLISPDIKSINVDKVLSFNYTKTFERIYEKSNGNVEYDFIHGKANCNREPKENNMVLGVDEYLPDKLKDKEIKFIQFKKYFQRICKETGCAYKTWAREISRHGKGVRAVDGKDHHDYLYIFGHSLDITDKDVLKELILQDNVITTIFYVDKDRHAQQIANLVKLIGQDELIKKVSEPNKTIIFKQQQDMIPMV